MTEGRMQGAAGLFLYRAILALHGNRRSFEKAEFPLGASRSLTDSLLL